MAMRKGSLDQLTDLQDRMSGLPELCPTRSRQDGIGQVGALVLSLNGGAGAHESEQKVSRRAGHPDTLIDRYPTSWALSITMRVV